MGQRNSQQDSDGLVWQTAGIPLGAVGLDLRIPVTPGSLTRLNNARFLDEKTVQRRDGHIGTQVLDASAFPAVGSCTPVGWIYGHGQRLDPTNLLVGDYMHYPVAGQTRGTFNYEGADVVWTGDRLLVLRDDGNPALGASTFWRRDGGSTPLSYGIPAYLPLQTDSYAPDTIAGSIVETALTETLRLIVAPSGSNLYAWLIDRGTGAVIDKSELGGVSGMDSVVALNSAGFPTVVWRNGDNKLCYNYWTGTQWAGKTDVATSVSAISVAAVDGGFHVAWVSSGTLKVGKYAGHTSQDAPYAFGTTLPFAGTTPSVISLAVAPDGTLTVVAYVAASNGLFVRSYTSAAVGTSTTTHQLTCAHPTDGTFDAGPFDATTCAARSLRNSNGFYPVVVAASGARGVHLWEVQCTGTGSYVLLQDAHRYNSALASHAFLVGDEVLTWLRSTNASTDYLVAGVNLQVCGYADRENAYVRNTTLSTVTADPRSATAFTWARPFTTVQAYARAGNALIGDLEFLPQLSTVQYGRSMYLSGSAVRNWDGVQLGDAGFQDYPLLSSVTPVGSGGSLTAGQYEVRVYAVRYNARGERFQSAAVSSGLVTAVANDSLTVVIDTLPSTNHTDVQLEVYRTEAGGTTFYLDGTVANSLTAPTVSYTSTQSDANLRKQPGDPFDTGVGNVSEIENWGPVGCATLTIVGDRIWTCGGQVPAGFAQFSKLKEDGSGVGFDDLASLEEINTTGTGIVSIASYGDSAIFLERDRIDVLAGPGPDNDGNGAWAVPQLVLSDGAISPWGTVVTQFGVFYWADGGPRLLDTAFRVQNISLPIRSFTSALTPVGVRADLARREVVWYTQGGAAVHLNYAGQSPRWAIWTGLPANGVSTTGHVTPDGWFMVASPYAAGDAGRVFPFDGCTSELSPDGVLGGASSIRAIGFVGSHDGPFQFQVRVYYNGSPGWTDSFTWEPEVNTWLESAEDLGTLTAAQIDALPTLDRSGQCATHKRVSRPDCRTFRVEWSDVNSDGATFTPFELTAELGTRAGLGRVAVNTFGG